mmetsp:Transcript_9670/g.13554  ORF Transcript_9670/g.13554 Transcript_9670/m.13554 type:complete len:582 (+) Transcript_9670:18-1763(+)
MLRKCIHEKFLSQRLLNASKWTSYRALNSHKFKEAFLDPCPSNYEQLSPVSFLKRTSNLFESKPAILYSPTNINLTYIQFQKRCSRLASSLIKEYGVKSGDVVSIMCFNTPPMFEAHFAVPGCRAVLHTINVRLSPSDIAFQLEHAESKVLLFDIEFSDVIQSTIQMIEPKHRPSLVKIEDKSFEGKLSHQFLECCNYEDLICRGNPNFELMLPESEHDAIALCYTSGTTGNPKGVITHHRGAYLTSLAWQQIWRMDLFPKFLWIVPLFHCNGWCLPWTMAAQAGLNICQRHFTGSTLSDDLLNNDVTHMAGAPVIMNMLLSSSQEKKQKIKHKQIQTSFLTAGAPPPIPLMERFKSELGIDITTAYGLTETYGPLTCSLSTIDEKEKILHQAFHIAAAEIRVVDPDTYELVPKDGVHVGEVIAKGNTIMKGYLRNERATLEAFQDGWFRTGDLAVWYPSGIFEIKDRAKDVIISGGENIMSVEVESALYSHPNVVGVACVAMPDDFWGEVVCAVVETDLHQSDKKVTESELIEHTRNLLAHYKIPKLVLFRKLPRTATGKIQKHILKKELLAELIDRQNN